MTTIPNRQDIDKLTNGDVKMTRAIEDLFKRVTVSEEGIASGADATTGINNATVVTLSSNDAFGNERILAAAQPLAIQDNGAGGTVVIGLSFPFVVTGGYAFTINLQADTNLTAPTSGLIATQPFPGPFANDAAAATAGVPVGMVYLVTSGAVAWRQV